MLTPAEMGALFTSFERSAFRVELLPEYLVPEEATELATYLGADPTPAWVGEDTEWRTFLRSSAEAGRQFSRVHVVRGPLTPYLQYECEWGYAFNSAVGDAIGILDLSEVDYADPLPEYDYWLFDDVRAARMHYAADGSYLHSELVPGGEVEALVRHRAALTAAAVPFAEYWAAHPEYHRGF